MTTHGYFLLLGTTQLVHSQEEIWTGFHKKWFVFTMPLWVFIAWEVLFSLPIVACMLNPKLSFISWYVPLFALLMFVNGMEHIIWGAVSKKYVPGLITAPVFIIIFCFYYFTKLGG
jgi:Protein of unknown function with HXXEE motif